MIMLLQKHLSQGEKGGRDEDYIPEPPQDP